MNITSARAKELDAYLSGKSPVGERPLVVGGNRSNASVWEVPTRMLRYNIRNGRFAAELRQLQVDLGRELDPLIPSDSVEIKKLLLNLSPTDTALLRADICKYGQLEPGIATYDGFVINGNRRMAVLEELHIAEPTGKWEHMQVLRLPKNVNQRDLWRIEAGLQISRDKRLDYGPVNDLLKIREGVESGLKPHEIAATLYGIDEEQVKFKLTILKLIDQYLESIGRPEAYKEVDRKVEHFISLEKYVMEKVRNAGLHKRLQQQCIVRGFELIKADAPHLEVRKLREVYLDPDAREQFLSASAEPPPPPAQKDKSKSPKFVPPIPRQGVLIGIKADGLDENDSDASDVGGVRDALGDALDTVKLKKEKEKPAKLLDAALRALTLIDPQHPQLQESQNRKRLMQLASLVRTLQDAVGKSK